MNRFLGLLVVTAITFGLVAGCAPGPAATPVPPTPAPSTNVGGTLTVYAAASLTAAFQELAAEFEKANPGAHVDFNFAGSQDLVSQIGQGARADVFASADLKNMEALANQGLVGSEPQVLARNRLVVILPRDNPAGLSALRDLARPGIKLVVAGESVPVGSYTLQMLDELSADAAYGSGFKDAVLKNVVSQENNVKAILSKIVLGEGDAGVVYTTDAASAGDQVKTIDVPDRYNVIALYPIATVKGAVNPALAAKWIAFVLSPQAQAILAKYGFIPPS